MTAAASGQPRRWRTPQERIRHEARVVQREACPQLKHLAMCRDVHPSQVTRELQGERRGCFEETAIMVYNGTVQARIDVPRLLDHLQEVHRSALRSRPIDQVLEEFITYERLETERGHQLPVVLYHMGAIDFHTYVRRRAEDTWHATRIVRLAERLRDEGIDPRGER